MNDSIGTESLVGTLFALTLDVGVKSTVLLVLAAAIHAALGRRRALVRSALWNASLVGLLVIPAASWGLPRLRVAVLPEPRSADGPDETANVVAIRSPASTLGDISPAMVVANSQDADLETSATVPPLTAAEPARLPFPSSSPDSTPIPWGEVLIGIYASIASMLGVRLAMSLWAVGRLKRACQSVREPRWVSALANWQGRLGIVRRVPLLQSDRVSIPMVVGWLAPAVILPHRLVEAAGVEVINAVILHELGHIRRGDYGWNLLYRALRIIYWPHPLVWLTGRIVGTVREQACDDLCIHALGGPQAYRRSLVEVAAGLLQRPDPAIGLMMARTSNLGYRLAWIMHSRGASRCRMRGPARWTLLLIVVTSASVMGAVELARRAVTAAEQPATRETDKAPDDLNSMPASIEILVMAKDFEPASRRGNHPRIARHGRTAPENRPRRPCRHRHVQGRFP